MCNITFSKLIKSRNKKSGAPEDSTNVAFLSLGGNLGRRQSNLNKAKIQIIQTCGRIEKISSIYETQAWGINSKKNI